MYKIRPQKLHTLPQATFNIDSGQSTKKRVFVYIWESITIELDWIETSKIYLSIIYNILDHVHSFKKIVCTVEALPTFLFSVGRNANIYLSNT